MGSAGQLPAPAPQGPSNLEGIPEDGRTLIPMPPPTTIEPGADLSTLDVSALESWLWDAACQIRGPLDAPKFNHVFDESEGRSTYRDRR
jgi:hypothetical protein